MALSNNLSPAVPHPHVALTCGIQPLENHDGKTPLLLVLGTFLQQVEYRFSLRDPRCALQRGRRGPFTPARIPLGSRETRNPRSPGGGSPTSRRRCRTAGAAGGRARRRGGGPGGQRRSIAAGSREPGSGSREPGPAAARKGAGGGGGERGKRNYPRRRGKRLSPGKSPAKGCSSEGRVFSFPPSRPHNGTGVNGLGPRGNWELDPCVDGLEVKVKIKSWPQDPSCPSLSPSKKKGHVTTDSRG